MKMEEMCMQIETRKLTIMNIQRKEVYVCG